MTKKGEILSNMVDIMSLQRELFDDMLNLKHINAETKRRKTEKKQRKWRKQYTRAVR